MFPSRRLRYFVSFTFLTALCALTSLPLYASEYPDRPIRMIVPYAAGGSSDIVGRIIAEFMQRELSQSVVIENVGGGGGANGATRAATASPDGYTLFLGANSEMLINKLLQPKLSYDASKDFTPVALIGTGPIVILGKPELKATDIAGMNALSKASGSGLGYGTSGHGTIQHLIGEMVKARTNANITHVPYRGAGPLMNDVIAGHVDLGIATLASSLPLISSGKAKPIAVSSAQRTEFAPDIPTLAENRELNGFDLETWYGVFGPANLPPAITQKLEQVLLKVLDNPELKKKLAAQAISTRKMSSKELGTFIASENEKYRGIISEAKIKIE